jgi:hypothetical protein
MKTSKTTKFIASAVLLLSLGAAHAQGSGLSYSGYNIGYLNTNRFAASDTDGANFSGSFALTDTLFAQANVAALKSIGAGKVGLGIHAPVPSMKNTDVYAIAGVARNTNYNKGWGSNLTLGAKSLLSPKWELNMYGSYTDLNTYGLEREASIGIGYIVAKDLILRARSFRSTSGQGYEFGVGSRF